MREKQPEILQKILHLFSELSEPYNPTQELQAKFGLSRQQVARYLLYLCKQNLIEKIGAGRGVKYYLKKKKGKLLDLDFSYSVKNLKKLGEDFVFAEKIKEAIEDLAENVYAIIHHIFTEMTNNVIDHSQAKKFVFSIQENRSNFVLTFIDDGIGIFKKNQLAFQSLNLLEAVAETAKGRRTTDLKNHSGEGIYFSSRLADTFFLQSDGLKYGYYSPIDDWSIEEIQPKEKKGTTVIAIIDKKSKKLPEDVFNLATNDEYEFKKGGRFLVNPYEISLGEQPISRSEAKRLLVGAEKFDEIILDFKNTIRIGQGFADEVFRVFQNKHPKLQIIYKNANSVVEFMIKRACSYSGRSNFVKRL